MAVNIRNESHTMYFRGPSRLKRIYSTHFREFKLFPLMAVAAPYQTGFSPSKKMLSLLKKLELLTLKLPLAAYLADQVVVYGKAGP